MALSPLFDIYDPGGELRSQFDVGIPQTGEEALGLIPIRKRPQVADLLPEEEKTNLLRQLANAGSSGLSAFGWLLDTPGAMVRGGLSGGLGKAVSALWEDSEQRVTGRELARQYGLVGADDTWSNFGGGLLAEIALDPLSYVGIGLLGRGAKTAAAKAAERAGLMGGDLGLLAKQKGMGTAEFLRQSTPETLIELAGDEAARKAARAKWEQFAGEGRDALLSQPLTRMNRVSIPGFQQGAVDLLGEGIGDAVARLSDTAVGKALDAPLLGPALRTGQAFFDPRVMGFTDADGQLLGRKITEANRRSNQAMRQQIADANVDAFLDLGEETYRDPKFWEAIRNYRENQLSQIPPEMLEKIRSPAGTRLTSAIDAMLNDRLVKARELGIPLEEYKAINDVGYFPRQQVEIDSPRYDPRYVPKTMRARRGAAIAQVGEGGTAGRRDYTAGFPTWVLDKMNKDQTLQATLRDLASNTGGPGSPAVRDTIDTWLKTNASQWLEPDSEGYVRRPFEWFFQNADPFTQPERYDAAVKREAKAYEDLANSLRRTPLQAAQQQIPKFGNALNDFVSNMMGRARAESNADVLLRELADPRNIIEQAAGEIPGGIGYSAEEALKELGFITKAPGDEPAAGLAALAKRMGRDPADLANVSFDRRMIDRLTERLYRARTPREAEGVWKLIQNYTNSFKTLALASPARSVRDLYSGGFAGFTQDAFAPGDWASGSRLGGGDYASIPGRLRGTPQFPEEMTDDEILRKFLKSAGGVGLGDGAVADDLGRAAGGIRMQETFPGAAGPVFRGLFNKNWRDWRTYFPFSTRGQAANPNPALDFFDRLATKTDQANRLGTYLNRIRKGDSPERAKDLADLTQVLYGNENFTTVERDYLSKLFPFYRYTKGITPLAYKELVENPAGKTGQSIRAINRASEPSEDRFVPEYLRQSAAIPLDNSIPYLSDFLGVQSPGVTRFLTNIDLPLEGLMNLYTPGLGNTVAARVGDSLMKTGSNILGQTNPLIKGPLEWILNRQFYSGRQLSDLYSMLEHDIGSWGRLTEQALVNAPGGSRLLGAIRQMRDSRISPSERAAKMLFNTLTGLKVQDVDQDKTLRLAARTTLNQLLDQAPGMSTYENLFIKPEDLQQLSPQEQRQYLLYRVLQSAAAKKARDKKKAAEDPLAILGLA